jgi:hypothetical protein
MLLAESTYDISREIREALKMDPRINIPWGDWMLEEDNRKKNFYLNLSDSEWENGVKSYLRNYKGDLRSALAWVERVQQQRVERAMAKAEERPQEKPTELDITFGVWKDMVEEPWKYSDDDWAEWLEMDAQLWNSPKRWRLAAFWQKRQDEADLELVTRIQAAWRGHNLRNTHPQLNCAKCLAHTPCRYKDGGAYLCWDCAFEYDASEWAPCMNCGCDVHIEEENEYRPGFWCSRSCAYD